MSHFSAKLIRQQESPFDGDEPGCGLDQACRSEFSRTVNLDFHSMNVPESLYDKVKVTIAGCQHGNITFPGQFNHIERDTYVPVALRGPIASLNERLEFHFEADGREDLLKPDLLRVTAIDGIREGMYDFPSRGHNLPERRIIEVTSVGLPHGVEDVLHIDKDCDALHKWSAFSPISGDSMR